MASIGEPFLLTTYSQPKRTKSTPIHNVNHRSSSLYASQPEASSSKYVTISASGDGVHVLDTSALHPAISHTLGPQVAFSCPPVSWTTHSETSRTCTTYAVIDSAPDVKPDERGRTVWKWEDDPSGGGAASEALKSKHSASFSHRISLLHRPECLPDYVILIGDRGQVTVTDSGLEAKTTFIPESEDQTTVSSFVFSRETCTFAPSRATSRQSAIIVSINKKGDSLDVKALSVDKEGRIKHLGTVAIPSLKPVNVLDVSCSATGFLTILESSGLWHSYQLESPDYHTVSVAPAADPTYIRLLTALQSSQDHSPAHSREISILPLTASHVLLAGLASGPSPELWLLLWDLQYSIVLASHSMNLPTSLSRSKKQGLQIQLVGGKRDHDQVLLILSPHTHPAAVNGIATSALADSNARSSVFVVPLTTPRVSTIANAMGRAAATAKWIEQAEAATSTSISDVDESQNKLLDVVRSSLDQKRIDAADEAFFKWVSEREMKESQQSPFSHHFVQRLLGIVFKQTKGTAGPNDIPYSPKIVQYLLEKKVVTSGMVEKGLFSALKLRQDWGSIIAAFTSVIDIPESDIVSFLHDVIQARQKIQSTSDENAMDVDTTSSSMLPSLPKVLALVISYPVTAPTMRLAIKAHLHDADELNVVLSVIVQWVEAWCSEELALLPEKATKDSRGVMVPLYTSKRKSDLPPLEKILTFLQLLLDSSFIAFLSHPASQQHIRQIFSLLEPEVSFNNGIEQLRGPLQPFVNAYSKVTSDALRGTQKQDPKVDWRKRKKAAHDKAAMTVGVYQVEELVL